MRKLAFGAETLLNQVRKESEKAEIQGTERYKTETDIYRKIDKLTDYEGEAVPELPLTLLSETCIREAGFFPVEANSMASTMPAWAESTRLGCVSTTFVPAGAVGIPDYI